LIGDNPDMASTSTAVREPQGRGVLAATWRPGGLVYLAFCVAGLLAGVFANDIYPPRQGVAAPVPALSALAAGQGLFILVGWPVLCLWRSQAGSTGRYAAEAVVEAVAWTIIPAPLYVAAAWLADATAGDAIRAAVGVAALWPLAIGAGALLRARPALRPGVIVGLLVLLACPAVWYIWREFLGAMPAGWLWDLGPATYLWQAGGARQPGLLAAPAWPMAVWIALGAAMATAGATARS